MQNEGIEITHSKAHMASYGLGATINQFLHMAFVSLGFYFYEVEIGLNVWLTSLGYILFAIWNAANDPLVGYLTDKPFKFTKRWGRRFPWMIIGGIPWILSYILIFLPPNVDPESGALFIFLWLVFTTCLFDTLLSVWWVNYYSLYPDKFRSAEERRSASGIITPIGIIGVALGGIVPPLFIRYGDTQSFVIQAIVVVLICFLLFLLAIPGFRDDKASIERYMKKIEEQTEKENFFKSLKNSLKHKSFVVYIVLTTFFFALAYCIQASIPYVVRFILKESSSSQIILQVAFLIGALVSIPFWIKFANKINDNRKILIISSGLVVIFTIPLTFLTGVFILFIILFLWGVSYGGMWAMLRVVIADVIDESIAMTGKRKEGVYNGIYQFFGRIAIILQAITFAIIHMLTGFEEGVATQSMEAIWGIQLHFGIIPALYLLVGVLIFWKYYDLTTERLEFCHNKIKELGL
ncbi:MAG: MFS transporter [Candidatus Lokiarchaeota archaeon]|nr:MFS transporter [Candidatus Lokiarchaeota archaeon]MBD3338711.1 MFS transporter [Candidatus Lokiarchaeota archaeon]